MATNESTTPRRPMGLLMCLCALIFTVAFILVSWPTIQHYLAGLRAPVPAMLIVTATPGVGVRPTQPGYAPPRQSSSDMSANPANMATAQAQADAAYATAVAGTERVPVPNTGQGEPAVLGQRVADDRQPAPAYAPTAEPLPQTQVDGAFGSKPAPPVDIQATHQCKHGQVWTDAGCKNPTPVQ